MLGDECQCQEHGVEDGETPMNKVGYEEQQQNQVVIIGGDGKDHQKHGYVKEPHIDICQPFPHNERCPEKREHRERRVYLFY